MPEQTTTRPLPDVTPDMAVEVLGYLGENGGITPSRFGDHLLTAFDALTIPVVLSELQGWAHAFHLATTADHGVALLQDLAPHFQGDPEPRPTVEELQAEITQLRAERDQLRAELASRVQAAPAGDVTP